MNRYVNYISACLVLLVAAPAVSQEPLRAQFPEATVAAVERLYPGFAEVLESHDPGSLSELAETLTASRSPDVIPVLAWLLEHRPESNPDRPAMAIAKLLSAGGAAPAASLSRALQNGTADQRRAAAVVFLEAWDALAAVDRSALERTLIAALADPSIEVRTWVAMSLRRFETPDAKAALEASVAGPHVTAAYYSHATGVPRPSPARPRPAFPRPVADTIRGVAPQFEDTLERGDEQAMRALVEALAKKPGADTALVLTWILANGDASVHGRRVAYVLAEHRERTGAIPVEVIAALLRDADPDRRFAAAYYFEQLLGRRTPRLTTPERAAVVAALSQALADPVIDVAQMAAAALSRARAPEAVPALLQSLERRDASSYFLTTAFRALTAARDSRALPVLRQWARTPGRPLREEAASAAIAISGSRNHADAARSLLWEEPDTQLEREVLARGTTALPLAWEALAATSAAERRAAAALLAWYRDVRSISHISNALDSAPGALTRQQLLFDLNAILLTEGAELRESAVVDLLARDHLRRMLDDLAASVSAAPGGPSFVPCQSSIMVYPRTVSADFTASFGDVRVVVASSPTAFDQWIRQTKIGCGITFHPIRTADGVARVATTIFRPGEGTWPRAWITLHRKSGEEWAIMPSPRHRDRGWSINDPNLHPSINRHYGAQDPLKLVRLDLLMERVRVQYRLHDGLHAENIDPAGGAGPIDESYVPLLERYRRDPDANVRYTAEFERARITGVPDLRVMIGAIENEPEGPIRSQALQILDSYVREQFDKHGRPAADDERAILIRLASAPQSSRGPQRPPGEREITRVRRWETFALVDIVIGEGIRAESGYSLLYERRGGRWVHVTAVGCWIS